MRFPDTARILAVLLLLASPSWVTSQQGISSYGVTATPLSDRVAIGEIGTLIVKITGGDAEVTPDPMKINLAEKMEVARHDNEFLIVENKNQFRFKSPLKPGAYRFFVYAYDGNGNAATANIPFYVRR